MKASLQDMARQRTGLERETVSRTIVHFRQGKLARVLDTQPLEAPLRIFLDGELLCETMRTPGADRNLAAGLACTSGAVVSPEAVKRMRFHETDNELFMFSNGAMPRGRASAWPRGHEDRERSPGNMPLGVLASALLDMRAVLENSQRLFKQTGATHSAMLFDRHGSSLARGEDVGRHNAFDKAVGLALLRGTLERAAHAVITSRLSHEIVLKAVRAGIPVLAGFSAATSLAVDLAARHGVTLVSRLRHDTMNIYR